MPGCDRCEAAERRAYELEEELREIATVALDLVTDTGRYPSRRDVVARKLRALLRRFGDEV